MKTGISLAARLEFLARVTDKECQHLLDTDSRLFVNPFTSEEAEKIASSPVLAERLDAFVARFGRLQDTVGDKLLPALVKRSGGTDWCGDRQPGQGREAGAARVGR